ncbi:MAG TPA: hypothetical protein VJK54_05200 [Chthoniobacterales bacterium]|nr:hypothetical protein [Chthoniobacterales bacterium]
MIERPLSFDFSTSIVSVSEFKLPATLPANDLSPPLLSDAPISSKLENLFKGNELDQLESDSMALAPETLQVLAGESLRSLLTNLEPLLESAGGIAPMHEIDQVAQLLSEELINQELLAAFRRAILGG